MSGVIEPIFTKNTAFNIDFCSTIGTITQANDQRLSDSRTPLSLTHTALDIFITPWISTVAIDGSSTIGFDFDNQDTDVATFKFTDTTGWTPGFNGSNTPVFDNVNPGSYLKHNTVAIRIGNTTAGVSSTHGKNKVLPHVLDLTDVDCFSIWVYVDGDLVNTGFNSSFYGAVFLGVGDEGLANASWCNIFGAAGGSWHKGWNNVTVNKADISNLLTGTGVNWSNVGQIQLRINQFAQSDGTVMYIDDIIVGGNLPSGRIPVVVTLDDNKEEQYLMTKIMNAYGIPVSLFVMPDEIDNHATFNGYITLQQCKDLYYDNNHIGMHHSIANGFAKTPSSMQTVSNWLSTNGFTRDDGHLYGAYPNGAYNQTAIDAAKTYGIRGLRSLTGIARNDSESIEASTGLIERESILNGGIADPFRINSHSPSSSSDASTKIDDAIAHKSAFISYNHVFSEISGEAEWIAYAKDLKSRVDNGEIECMTFPRFCQKYDESSKKPLSSNHTHKIADINGLQTALDNKVEKVKPNTVAILGDSFDVRALEDGSSLQTYAIWQLTNMLLQQKMDFVNIDGVSDSGVLQTPSYASRIQASVYDHNPHWCAVRCSVNDVHNNNNTLDDLISAYSVLFKDINDHGISIITNTIAPSNGYDTPKKKSNWLKFNQWLVQTAANTYDMVILNQNWQCLDNTKNDGAVDTSLTDVAGVHPDLNGAFLIAQDSAKQLEPFFTNLSYVDTFTGIGDNENTVIDPNPFNVGTTGSINSSGGNSSGVVSDGYDGYCTSGTAVFSKVPRVDAPGEWQQVVFSPVSTDQLVQYAVPSANRTQAKPAGMIEGDEVQAFLEFEIDLNTPDADGHYPLMFINFMSGSTTELMTSASFGQNSIYKGLGKTGWRGVIKTVRAAIPVGCDGFQIIYKYYNKTLNPQTIRFGRHGLINHTR